MIDVVQPCVLPNNHAGMPRLMSSNRMFCPRAMIKCHTIRHPTIYAALGHCGHVTLDVIQRFLRSKGDNDMPYPTSSDLVFCPRKMITCHARCHSTLCVLFKGDDGMPHVTLFDRIFCPRAMIACHARYHSTMYFSLR